MEDMCENFVGTQEVIYIRGIRIREVSVLIREVPVLGGVHIRGVAVLGGVHIRCPY